MTIRGRAKSAPEVSVCVLAHVFGELGLQEVATPQMEEGTGRQEPISVSESGQTRPTDHHG
jgi:hypothetical protein